MLKSIISLAALALVFVLYTGEAEASCGTAQSYNSSTWQSCNSDTSHAGIYSSGCYGRCGPACNWTWLGNVYTNACKTHDWCVRDGLARGRSQYSAHANCVGSLGSAARSWFSNNWHTWKGKIRDKVTGFISNWL
ncbi:MAG: hypothetical protein HS111_12690 [Kofleriaceae bacterium]|nr:hypothetical protein [Kofleriaceae bacterium]MCL4224218.1 hypothetical protein [Myxococcales bacterium]